MFNPFIKRKRQSFIGKSKQPEESWKYNVQLNIFYKSLVVWIAYKNTVSSVWYIFSIETKN